ncbi:hypothetical protein CK203_027218 [Vitis vinifera]|uniref:Uncharacterized protein n=1 Tax=Vitis vinifera TaxID=29760 RepID=A0A438I687_VITVI|nr:hypothetical protein CK203_027218 [Vitis vinifera]
MKEHNHETRRICEVHVKIKLLIHFPSQPNASDKIHDVATDSLRLQLEQSLLHRKSEPDSSWPKTNDAAIRLQRNKAVMSLQVTLAR